MFNLPGIFSNHVIPKRFERLTHALEGRCSIQLSYGTSLICGAKVVILFFNKQIFLLFFLLNSYVVELHKRRK